VSAPASPSAFPEWVTKVTDPLVVAIVDDHRLLTDAIRLLLKGEPGIQIAGVFHTAEEALSSWEQSPPDIVLMDIDLPGMDGIEATRLLLEAHPDTKVIVITAYQESDLLTQAVRLGAVGYVPKTHAAENLVQVIRLVGEGQMVLPADQLAALFSGRPVRGGGGSRNAHSRELTVRETRILQEIADGWSTVDIAGRLSLSPSTVRGYLKDIMARLGVHSQVEAVAVAIRSGLVRRRPSSGPSSP
jgi:two-component system, NarL family, response regulator LiaR